VPLYDSLGENAIEYIIKHSESTVVFAQSEKLGTLAKSVPHVRAGAEGDECLWAGLAWDIVSKLRCPSHCSRFSVLLMV
jgi:long-subunit acyl-CoA synthetase (AMP-forming)